MEIYQAVGQNIHRIRKAQQLSIDRAAALSGVSKSMLGQIERGLVNPTVSVLARIAGGLHVPIEQLVECREETPAQLHRAVDVVGARLCGGKVIRGRYGYGCSEWKKGCKFRIHSPVCGRPLKEADRENN